MLYTKDNLTLSFMYSLEMQFQFNGFRALQQSTWRVNLIILKELQVIFHPAINQQVSWQKSINNWHQTSMLLYPLSIVVVFVVELHAVFIQSKTIC